ncbi:MAG: AMP-binding protein [Thermodesulfobacteriota bacterium]
MGIGRQVRVNFGRQMQYLARAWSSREALVNRERGRRYTYKEFHLLTNKIANMIRDRFRLSRGDAYMNILQNDNLSLIHVWTVFKGEASCAFTNYRDSIEEHTWQIDTVKPKLVFLENSFLAAYYEMLQKRRIHIVCMDPPDASAGKLKNVYYFWDLIKAASGRETDVEHDMEEDVMQYRFTGGTTGRGKCAMYTIRNWEQNRATFLEIEDPMTMGLRFLHFGPLSHGAGMFMYPVLFLGGVMVTLNSAAPEHICEAVEAEQIEYATLVPTMLYRFLEFEDFKKYDLSSLRTIYYGAAPMSPERLLQLQERFGNIFVQVYGSTEHLGLASTLSKSSHIMKTDKDRERLGSVGTVTPGIELKIVNPDGDDKELPFGQIGEIWMRSSAVIKGYLNSPEETEKEFHNGWWKSGDIGKMDEDGYVYILDRKKDIINSGGYNVYAAEVEAVIASHPAVLMSAVVGAPHDEWGETVLAEIQLKAGAKADEEEIIGFCRERMAKYKVPKSVVFVNELPISPAHKVLRRKVREKYWEGRTRGVN